MDGALSKIGAGAEIMNRLTLEKSIRTTRNVSYRLEGKHHMNDLKEIIMLSQCRAERTS